MYTKSEITIDSGDIVMVLDVDVDEFASICNNLKSNTVYDAAEGEFLAAEAISAMFNQGCIPLIKRGIATQSLFNKYQVFSEYITVILTAPQNLVEGLKYQPLSKYFN